MSIALLIIILQIGPLLYLLYWGYTNNKISEYLIWVKFVCRGRKKCIDPKKGGREGFFQMNREVKIGPRRASIEMRIGNEGGGDGVHRKSVKEVHDIILS